MVVKVDGDDEDDEGVEEADAGETGDEVPEAGEDEPVGADSVAEVLLYSVDDGEKPPETLDEVVGRPLEAVLDAVLEGKVNEPESEMGTLEVEEGIVEGAVPDIGMEVKEL